MSKNWCNDPKPADNNHKIIFVPSSTVPGLIGTTLIPWDQFRGDRRVCWLIDFTKKAGKYSKTTYSFWCKDKKTSMNDIPALTSLYSNKRCSEAAIIHDNKTFIVFPLARFEPNKW